jgi:uncharacterized membrane protein
MPQTHPDAPPPPFPWKKAWRNSIVKGAECATLGGAATAVTAPEPVTVAIVSAISFAGGVSFGMFGEYMNHKTDDPAPVFDARTTLLFDTVGMVVCFLLFVIPAIRLDHALGLSDPQGWRFFYMALFLSAFLVTILRGLMCNLGLAREADRRDLMLS